MPSITRRGKRWRVQIRRLGYPPQFRTFGSKADAMAWAVEAEREVASGTAPGKHTLADAFRRYAREESPKKRGRRWEVLHLSAWERSRLAATPLSRLSEADLSRWREDRLQAVSGATVRREMNLLQSVLEVARREWKWIARNPIKDVAKPPSPPARRKGVPPGAMTAICAGLTGPVGEEVAAVFLLAVETGMRAGEVVGLEWPRVDLDARVVRLEITKNGRAREVPLSTLAADILAVQVGKRRPFMLSSASLDRLFRKARDRTAYRGVHFHDSRSEAITRLAKRFDVLTLAAIIGHADIRSLMSYFSVKASELATRLD